jgi:hypothetical protein
MAYTALAVGTVDTAVSYHYLAINPVIFVGISGGSGGGATPNPKTSGVKKGI